MGKEELMSLVEVIEYAIVIFDNCKIPLKPYHKGWHLLFYSYKQSQKLHIDTPACVADLRFDANGPYPKARTLTEFLTALCWIPCLDQSNSFDEYKVDPGVKEIWEQRYLGLSESAKWFMSDVLARARNIFLPVIVEEPVLSNV